MGTRHQDISLVPTDIWAYLACYFTGEDFGVLKMTGAKYLWSKLCHPHVVKSVQLGTSSVLFKTRPAFLNELPSIVDLSIDSPDIMWWQDFGLKLNMIPSTVRKLQFRGEYGPFEFFVDEEGHTLHLDKYLPHLEVLDLKEMRTNDDSWTTKFPQTLTNLGIKSWDGKGDLPSSLIHFEVCYLGAKSLRNDLNLPATLEVLIIDELRNENFDEEDSILELITKLPPTLTKLELGDVLPVSLWPLLPPSLQTLVCLANEPSSTVVSTTIYDPSTGNLHEVRSYPFGTLPRSITRLAIINDDEDHFSGPPSAIHLPFSSYFPPQLTTLLLPTTHLSPDAAKLLPQSLTHLHLLNLCERVCLHIPKGLLTLSAENTFVTPDLIKLLPKLLTSLDLSYATDHWYANDTGMMIESVSELPQYSLHANYGDMLDWKDDCSLPPSMTKLCLNFEHIGDAFLLNQKLSHLRKLDLGRSEHFTDAAISSLGSNLTYLNLNFAHNVTGDCFSLLPRSLTYLCLNASSSIQDSHIRHLPRSLKRLYLESAINLTDSCVSALPPPLEWIYLQRNDTITQSSLLQFPTRVRSRQPHCGAMFCSWSIMSGEVTLG